MEVSEMWPPSLPPTRPSDAFPIYIRYRASSPCLSARAAPFQPAVAGCSAGGGRGPVPLMTVTRLPMPVVGAVVSVVLGPDHTAVPVAVGRPLWTLPESPAARGGGSRAVTLTLGGAAAPAGDRGGAGPDSEWRTSCVTAAARCETPAPRGVPETGADRARSYAVGTGAPGPGNTGTTAHSG